MEGAEYPSSEQFTDESVILHHLANVTDQLDKLEIAAGGVATEEETTMDFGFESVEEKFSKIFGVCSALRELICNLLKREHSEEVRKQLLLAATETRQVMLCAQSLVECVLNSSSHIQAPPAQAVEPTGCIRLCQLHDAPCYPMWLINGVLPKRHTHFDEASESDMSLLRPFMDPLVPLTILMSLAYFLRVTESDVMKIYKLTEYRHFNVVGDELEMKDDINVIDEFVTLMIQIVEKSGVANATMECVGILAPGMSGALLQLHLRGALQDELKMCSNGVADGSSVLYTASDDVLRCISAPSFVMLAKEHSPPQDPCMALPHSSDAKSDK